MNLINVYHTEKVEANLVKSDRIAKTFKEI